MRSVFAVPPSRPRMPVNTIRRPPEDRPIALSLLNKWSRYRADQLAVDDETERERAGLNERDRLARAAQQRVLRRAARRRHPLVLANARHGLLVRHGRF